MKFSQRIGKTPVKTALQIESIDSDLMNRMWNIILEKFFGSLSFSADAFSETEAGQVCKLIWKEFFKKTIDTLPAYSGNGLVYYDGFIEFLRKWYFDAIWYEIYDFIEFLALIDSKVRVTKFSKSCNIVLKQEVAGYRLMESKIVQITSEEEIAEIESAINTSDIWKSVNTHLKTALEYLSDRKNPDYRNSIKESISSVESLCKIITNDNKATLGKALNEIEKTYSIHKALKNSFSSLYGYSSDTGGIRHALLENDNSVEFEDAKFMLVSCSAFINYLKTKMKK